MAAGAQTQYQAGLEVDNRYHSNHSSYTPVKPEDPYHDPEPVNSTAPARICGLPKRYFWIAFAVALVVIAGAVGGGVAGGLASRKNTTTSASSSPPSQATAPSITTTSSSSSLTTSSTTSSASSTATAFTGYTKDQKFRIINVSTDTALDARYLDTNGSVVCWQRTSSQGPPDQSQTWRIDVVDEATRTVSVYNLRSKSYITAPENLNRTGDFVADVKPANAYVATTPGTSSSQYSQFVLENVRANTYYFRSKEYNTKTFEIFDARKTNGAYLLLWTKQPSSNIPSKLATQQWTLEPIS